MRFIKDNVLDLYKYDLNVPMKISWRLKRYETSNRGVHDNNVSEDET